MATTIEGGGPRLHLDVMRDPVVDRAIEDPDARSSKRPKPRWMKELRRSISSAEELAQAFELTDSERRGAERAEREGLPIRITPHYLSLCDRGDPSCPIRRQCVPAAEEDEEVPGDLSDPLGEIAHEVAPHLIQRYPDRVLLLVTDRCGVYCRFCTRSRMVGDGGGVMSLAKLEGAFRYIADHREVRDVIISGGDPLTIATSRLVPILERLRAIEHVDTIRIGTRVPVTLPSRITAELVKAMRPCHPIWIMTHFNHPKELAKENLRALARLSDAGFPIMNQSVLLRGINDDAAVLEELFRKLIRARAKPYYLLQMDPVRGSAHLRTPLRRGLELMSALEGRLTGIAMPKFVVDTPGGLGKVALFRNALVAEYDGRTTLQTFRGDRVDYLDPPRSV